MKKNRWDVFGSVAGIACIVLAAIAVLRSGAPNRILVAAAVVVVFGGMGLLLYKFLWRDRQNTKRLVKSGISSVGTVLEMHETGISVNANPQVKLLLEITGPGGRRYTASCKIFVSAKKTPSLEPGSQVKVKVDPLNEQNVIVVAS